ncbi:MAG: hypothetical protein LC746_13850 [Acidobacteria bacterium]|nr:hypothetical protein [Acidobacteriota bacterium]
MTNEQDATAAQPRARRREPHALRPRTVLVASAIFLALHAAVWLVAAHTEPSRYPWPRDVRSMFEYWDAWHYDLIIERGYFGHEWAFYPLYPLAVALLARATGLASRPEIAGAIFSTLCFVAFCAAQSRLAPSDDAGLKAIKPAGVWGWLFFLLWPGSWVFHSHHTEALFLLLSFAALFASRTGRWKSAAVFAGLSALTRNQGVFVAVAVALDGALLQRDLRRRALVFSASGSISLLLFALYPAYQFWQTGDPLKSTHELAFWGSVSTARGYVATFWFANPGQAWNGEHYLHHFFFFVLNAAAVVLLLRREFALALYALLSLWSLPYMGQLLNTYRYGAVLFPALFLLGDLTARLPLPTRLLLFGCLLYLNYLCTRSYALGAWAY